MKALFAISAVAIVCATGARAADIAARPYTKASPMAAVAVYNWSGFYLGADIGGGWTRTGLSSDVPGRPLTYRPTSESFAGGAHVGYQHQWNQVVLGVEAAYITGFDRADIGGTIPTSSIFVPGGTSLSASVKAKDFWSVGGRVGWAFDNWLPYVTGGYASGTFDFNQAQMAPLLTTQFGQTKPAGYYIGGGIDWAPWKNGVIFGVEYRHYDFSQSTATVVRTDGFTEPVRFNPKADTVMGRISYKFGVN